MDIRLPESKDFRLRNVFIGLLISVLLFIFVSWLWWALWGNHSRGTVSIDRWLNVMTGFGALLTGVGVLVGGFFAWLYSRRASISITAKVYPMPDEGFLIAARPLVRAVGLLRVRFRGEQGATVEVAEFHIDDSAPEGTRIGAKWEHSAVFGDQHADGGEELPTTVMFRLGPPAETVVGWIVGLGIRARTRYVPSSSESWSDRVFVPRPNGKGSRLEGK